MHCEICGEDSIRLIVLPIPKQNGVGNTMACVSCATESGHYCRKHNQPHLGFPGEDDDRTACLECINVLVKSHEKDGPEIIDRLLKHLPDAEGDKLRLKAWEVEQITGTPIVTIVLRFIATRAVRFECDLEAMVKSLIEEQSVDVLFPDSPKP